MGPLLRAKLGRNADEMDGMDLVEDALARSFARRGGTKEALGYLDGGFGILAQRIAHCDRERGGEVRTADRVLDVSPNPSGGFDVVFVPGREHFDAVIAAVAPAAAREARPRGAPRYRLDCEAIEHSAILCTLLALGSEPLGHLLDEHE